MGTNFMKDELLFSWLNNLKPRTIENEVLSYLGKPFIVFLLGSRQVGKTSLMRRLMGDLRVEKKIDLRQILYFDFEIIADEATFLQVTPEAVEEIAKNYGADLGKEIYVFIDEIQYHPNPSNLLKVIFDHLPQFHLLVSGSSTTKIKEKFIENSGLVYDLKNTNDSVDKIPGVLLSKTGYTDLAGGNLVIIADIGLNNPVSIVILGSTLEKRESDVLELYNQTLKHYSKSLMTY